MRSFKAFDEISGSARKKINETGLRRLEIVCSVIALFAAFFCLLFLLGPFHSFWILEVVLSLGILLNLALMLAGLLRRTWAITGAALLLMLIQAAALIWFLI